MAGTKRKRTQPSKDVIRQSKRLKAKDIQGASEGISKSKVDDKLVKSRKTIAKGKALQRKTTKSKGKRLNSKAGSPLKKVTGKMVQSNTSKKQSNGSVRGKVAKPKETAVKAKSAQRGKVNGTMKPRKGTTCKADVQGEESSTNGHTPRGSDTGSSGRSARMPQTYPDIYEQKDYDDRYNLLSDKIVTDAHAWEVGGGFNCYIEEEIIEHSWKAVWKSHRFSYDVLVKIKEINYPHAKVELVKPYCFQPNDLGIPPKNPKQQRDTEDKLVQFLSDADCRVLLLEVVPVDDGSGDLDAVADVLEVYRFFYLFLWRETDDGYDTDYYWDMEKLQPRLKVYFDVKSKVAARTRVSEPYNRAMTSYHKKLWKYKIKKDEYYDNEEDDYGRQIMTNNQREELNILWRDLCKSEQILNRITEYHNRPRMEWVYVGPGADLDDYDF